MSVKHTVTHIDEIGNIVEELNKRYAEGKVKDVVICVLYDDDTCETGWNTGRLLTKLGLLENAKDSILMSGEE